VLVGAAVCPHPPLLIPAATGPGGLMAPSWRSEPSAGQASVPAGLTFMAGTTVRQAAAVAVSQLLSVGPDLVVVVGAAERSVTYPGDAAGSLRAYGVPFQTGTGEPVLPLSLTVGAWLLRSQESAQASGGPDGEPRAPVVLLQGVWHALPPAECLELGARLAASRPRVGLLVMGDGPRRRAAGPVGAADPAADAYDKELAAAFAAADTERLAALDPGSDAELMVAGRASWQVLAGAARGREFIGQLLYAAAPFEVSYLVATWTAQD
jgi:hypothetical protein